MITMKKIFFLIFLTSFHLSSLGFAETIVFKPDGTTEEKALDEVKDRLKATLTGVSFASSLDEFESPKANLFPDSFSSDENITSEKLLPGLMLSVEDLRKKALESVVYFRGSGLVSSQKAEGQGSGFLIDKDGIVVTNFHVVSRPTFVQVQLYDRRIFPIDSVIHCDVKKDFCILKINAQDLPFLELADSEEVNVKDKVFVIGNPAGDRNVLSQGEIFSVRTRSYEKVFETTAQVRPGNSGGPMLNERGEVIGIIRQGLIDKDLGIALAINEIKPFVKKDKSFDWYDFVQKKSDKNFSDFHLREAQWFNKKGDLETAIVHYHEFLKIFPGHFDSNLNLGQVYLNSKINDIEKAIHHLRAAIAVDQNAAEAYFSLGFAYQKKGKLNDAIYYYNHYLNFFSEDILTISLLGDIYIALEERASVLKQIQRLKDLGRSDLAQELEKRFRYR